MVWIHLGLMNGMKEALLRFPVVIEDLVPCIKLLLLLIKQKNTVIKETSSVAVFFCIPSCLSPNLCYDINI